MPRPAVHVRLGPAGVQVGTAFAFCEESGLDPALKAQVCALSRESAVRVFTDPQASPTGFPFKVLQLPGTLSDQTHYAARKRICDLRYLRESFRRPDGPFGYRCAGEPVDDFVRKGGTPANATGRKCLCNTLLADVDLGQRQPAEVELPKVTAGRDAADVARFLALGARSCRAAEVIASMLAT